MPSTYDSLLRLELQATGENSNTWGVKTNTNITLLAKAIAGAESISVAGSGSYTLSTANGADDEAREMFVTLTGLLTGNRTIIIPSSSKLYVFRRATTGNYTLSVKTASGIAVSLDEGATAVIVCDGTDCYAASQTGRVNYLDFNTSVSTAAVSVGRLIWNDTDGTLDLGLKGGSSVLQLGQEQLIRVLNNTSTTMTDGQVVYITGASGQRPTVALARANSASTSDDTVGFVTEQINPSSQGFVTRSGLVRNVNTTGLADGVALYLSGTTAGAYTTTLPTVPNHKVRLGYVVNGGSGGAGSILAAIDPGKHLYDLHDVSLATSVTPSAILAFDTSTSAWTSRDSLRVGVSTIYSPASKFRIGRTTDLVRSDETFLNVGNATFGSSQTGLPAMNVVSDSLGYLQFFYNNSPTQVGSITTDGSSVSFNTTSDYRAKKDVVSLSGAAAASMLQSLLPKLGRYVNQTSVTPVRPMFLAHELAEVLPCAVVGTHNGATMQAAQYDPLMPVIVAALQNLLSRVSALESA